MFVPILKWRGLYYLCANNRFHSRNWWVMTCKHWSITGHDLTVWMKLKSSYCLEKLYMYVNNWQGNSVHKFLLKYSCNTCMHSNWHSTKTTFTLRLLQLQSRLEPILCSILCLLGFLALIHFFLIIMLVFML